jgi:hypothetical protein
MHSKTYLIFLCALCSFVLLACAAAIPTVDRLPSGVTKGYVEFYQGATSGKEAQASAIAIYQMQEEKEIYMGQVGSWSPTNRVRIACRPGQHTFVAKLGNAAERIQVEVKQDMLTPVRIIVTVVPSPNLGPMRGTGTLSDHFRMSLYAELATPIENYR